MISYGMEVFSSKKREGIEKLQISKMGNAGRKVCARLYDKRRVREEKKGIC